MLTELHAELDGTADELRRDGGRLRDAVLPASDGSLHVVGAEPAHSRRVDLFDGDAKTALYLGAGAQPRPALVGRGQEHVAHGVEQRRAQLAKELRALLGKTDLRLGRELLAEAAHRLPGRTGGDCLTVGEHDVVRAEQREVVRDRRSYSAGTGDDDASHVSNSVRSASVSMRNGRRT